METRPVVSLGLQRLTFLIIQSIAVKLSIFFFFLIKPFLQLKASNFIKGETKDTVVIVVSFVSL